MRVARCSEFPNDNASLHDGAIWRASDVGGAAEPVEPDDEAGFIEVVDELAFDDHVDEQSHAGETDPFETFARVLVAVAMASGADERATRCLRALLGESRLDGALLDEGVTETLVAGGVLIETDRGPVRAPSFTSTVAAWQGILRGESEDFAPCGAATLDEWSANVVARVLGVASRADGIRRELRRRGVAAFGFVADAAA
jgi:hypothetical protein